MNETTPREGDETTDVTNEQEDRASELAHAEGLLLGLSTTDELIKFLKPHIKDNREAMKVVRHFKRVAELSRESAQKTLGIETARKVRETPDEG